MRLLFWLLVSITLPTATAALPSEVQRLLREQSLNPAALSVYIEAVEDRRVLLAHHASTARNPASVMKVVTALAALDLLGIEYRWRTSLWSDAPLQGQQLQGDLVLHGSGDPQLLHERLAELLGAAQQQFRHIEGDILLDASYFALPPPDPAAFNGQPHRPYNALPWALGLNYQSAALDVQAAYGRIVLGSEPASANLQLVNQLQLRRGPCRQHRDVKLHIDREAQGGRVVFRGGFDSACGPLRLYRQVAHPPAFTAGIVQAMWRDLGGTLGGGVRLGLRTHGSRLLAQTQSDPLGALLLPMNHNSNNFMARQIALSLGPAQGHHPGSPAVTRQVLARWLAQLGIVDPTFSFDNGAGLSRQARLRADTTAQLLRHGLRHSALRASLPQLGLSGTLRRRLRDHPMRGSVYAKTGTLRDVRALAGYLQARSGRHYLLVILHNAPNIHLNRSGTRIQDALLTWAWSQG